MTVVLWVPLGVSVAIVGVSAGVHSWLVLLARKGTSGTEYMQIALAPLSVAAYVSTYVGGISGLLLASATGSPILRFLAGGLGGGLLTLNALSHVARLRERRRNRKLDRVISQDEMLELIRSQTIKGFCKQKDGVVRFTYVDYWQNGEYIRRPSNADGAGYPAYVAAADDVRRQHGHTVSYRNESDPHDPLTPGGRWITVEEATALLQANEIKTFAYTGSGGFAHTTFKGTPTGIRLLDHGWVRHIHVNPAMEATMIPIARDAQRRHGRPQFWMNGRYEQTPPDAGHSPGEARHST
ncbi:hypothetical protein JOF56_005988 [Kibdelosporangium banguiense]|uniref:Uncharacterized protein n=1 Tax=Kibdelosporangium banguiense TaxID=1365924 RepID=A0ABS4TMH4_9PSEU|nr:hypothetical protein [Kibdelosporangium banguiense]MBP2325603.1 hypothetical protein [Kibdelosporangium banguiense]